MRILSRPTSNLYKKTYFKWKIIHSTECSTSPITRLWKSWHYSCQSIPVHVCTARVKYHSSASVCVPLISWQIISYSFPCAVWKPAQHFCSNGNKYAPKSFFKFFSWRFWNTMYRFILVAQETNRNVKTSKISAVINETVEQGRKSTKKKLHTFCSSLFCSESMHHVYSSPYYSPSGRLDSDFVNHNLHTAR
jgi:hypothetical protein